MVISRKMQFSTFEPSQFTFEPAATERISGEKSEAAGQKSLGFLQGDYFLARTMSSR